MHDNLLMWLDMVANRLSVVAMRCTAVFRQNGDLSPGWSGLFFPGSLIRGAWGGAFRNLACDRYHPPTFRDFCPTGCECAFTTVFRSGPQGPCQSLAFTRNPPRPYRIFVSVLVGSRVRRGQVLDVDLLLIGEAVQAWEPSLAALMKALETGLGMDGKRIPGEVAMVRAMAGRGEWCEVWSASRAHEVVPPPVIPLAQIVDMDPIWKTHFDAMSLDFQTPTVFSVEGMGKKVYPPALSFHHLAQAAVNRIGRLGEIWSGVPANDQPRLDYDCPTQPVLVREAARKLWRFSRRSMQENTIQSLESWSGILTFRGEVGAYYPLFRMAGFLGLGQNTVLGFGACHPILHGV